jgi:peptide/nickel transport system permease protein
MENTVASITAPRAVVVRQPAAAAIGRWLRFHPYIAYAIRRVGMYLLTVWGAFTVAFFFFRFIPGDPIQAFLSSLAQQYVYNAQAGQAVVDHYREVFGLQGNLFQQYIHYMVQVFVTHDLGPALVDFPEPAQVIILRALPWTIGLLGLSAIIAWVCGVLVGALVGWRRNSGVSQVLTNFALAFSHVPYYFVALMLIFLVAYRLDWLPPSSAYDASVNPGFTLEFILSLIRHGMLPAISIVFIGVCNWMISTRMLMVTTLGEDYLTFADAKGLSPRHILTQYALRNCYLPQVTAFGISLGFIFNGNVLVEQVFNYPGVGNLFIQAIGVLDYDTIQGIVALVIITVLTANLLIDLALPALDPRVKYWH